MSELFQLQGMEQFNFQASEPYSSPHSQVFSLIAARDLALQVKADEGDDTLVTDLSEFGAVAAEIAEQYLFGNGDIRERVFLSVDNYLHHYPDERVKGYLEFARRPENQPQIEASNSIGSKTSSTGKRAAMKTKKKIAAASKRKNRSKK